MHDWLFNLADLEVVAVPVLVKVLGELVDSSDLVAATKGIDLPAWVDLVAGQVVVTNELLSGLINVPGFWKLLSSQ